MTRMSKVFNAEYDAKENVFRLDTPPEGVADQEKVQLALSQPRPGTTQSARGWPFKAVFRPRMPTSSRQSSKKSSRPRNDLEIVEKFVARHDILVPDVETARLYGTIRARQRLHDIRASKMNDLWIAALCLQHDLPLLTNDRGFDSIGGLDVIHW